MGIIYAFWQQEKIIYIGSSIRNNKKERYDEHKKANSFLNTYIRQNGGFKKFRFDILELRELSKEELLYLERSYIEKHKPLCNIRTPLLTEEEREYSTINWELRENQIISDEEECLKSMKV